MPNYFSAFNSTLLLLISVNLFGFSKQALPDLNYCTPLVVKENISIEKLQIGTWTATQPGVIVSIATLGSNPTYDFSIQGLPSTRDSFYWQIWIDLNQDLDFDDAGETLLKTATPRKQKAQGKISFPSALYGNTRVRIMLTKSKANNACGTAGKVLGYYDFWLQGNCVELSKTRWQIEEVRQNEVKLWFNWPASTTFHWQLKGEKETRWSNENWNTGDSLLLKDLNDFNDYSFRYRLKCGDANWTEWSDTIRLETLYKPVCSPIDTAQISIDSVGANHVFITVLPQENSEVYQYSFFSPSGKGDTVRGYAPYGQSKINLRLWDAEYRLTAVKKQCLDGSSSEWNYDYRSFKTPSNPCSGADLTILKNEGLTYAQASPLKKIQYEWRWRSGETLEWQELVTSSDSLSLAGFEPAMGYELQVRVMCVPEFWSDWSELKPFSIDRICPVPSLDSVSVSFTNKSTIKLSYTGKTHSKVIWNYPSNYQNCFLRSDTTQRELNVGYRNGERISVRLKGVCAWEESSSFSDTLNFERPCVAPKTSDFFVFRISDKTAEVWVINTDQCSGAYFYHVTTDTTLHDSLWSKLPDLGGGGISLQNLQPNTQYFLKISNQCYNDQNSVVYSGFKPFKTLPTINTCEAFDSTEISFRYDEKENYLWVRVKSSKVSVAKEVTLADANGYQITRSGGFGGDSTLFPLITTDTKYLLSIQNTCGAFRSEWTTVSHVVSSSCPKMSIRRFSHALKDDKYYLTYAVNPEIPILGPYLWRYRKSTYGSPWIDSLISETNVLELPQQLLGQSLAFSARPLASLACGEKYWSGINDYIFNLEPCPAPSRSFFNLDSISSNSATFFVYGEWIPEDAIFRLRNLEEEETPGQVFDLPKEHTAFTISNLKPNTRYLASICIPCQVGSSTYENCPDVRYFSTLKANFQPIPVLALSKNTVRTNMKLVPNPSTGLFQLELPSGLEGTATLTITNLNGQLIQRTPMQLFPGAQPQIDLSQQAQGVYFIHVQVGKQLYREKLVLIR